jgi:hypothetical protein
MSRFSVLMVQFCVSLAFEIAALLDRVLVMLGAMTVVDWLGVLGSFLIEVLWFLIALTSLARWMWRW